MRYLSLFKEALQRTTTFGIKTPIESCVDSSDLFLTTEITTRISDEFHKRFNDLRKSFGCAYVSSLMLPIIEDIVGEEAILTIGYIEFLNKTAFEIPTGELSSILKMQNKQKLANTHVWITLPSMEIIDFTFYHSMKSVSEEKANLLPEIYFGKNIEPENPKTPRFIPQLIGQDIAMRMFESRMNQSTGDLESDFNRSFNWVQDSLNS